MIEIESMKSMNGDCFEGIIKILDQLFDIYKSSWLLADL